MLLTPRFSRCRGRPAVPRALLRGLGAVPAGAEDGHPQLQQTVRRTGLSARIAAAGPLGGALSTSRWRASGAVNTEISEAQGFPGLLWTRARSWGGSSPPLPSLRSWPGRLMLFSLHGSAPALSKLAAFAGGGSRGTKRSPGRAGDSAELLSTARLGWLKYFFFFFSLSRHAFPSRGSQPPPLNEPFLLLYCLFH